MEHKFFADLKLSLYCASMLIGAALLTMPLRGARLGFGPLLAAIILLGLWTIYLNRRITESLYAYLKRKSRRQARIMAAGAHDRRGGNGRIPSSLNEQDLLAEEVRQRGSHQWVEQVRAAGYGTAGRWCILLGTFLFVFFADIGYLILGSRSLFAIAAFVNQVAPHSFVLLAGCGLFAMACSIKLERLFTRPFLLRGILKKVSMMFGAWLIGIAVIGLARQAGLIGDSGALANWAALLGLMLFTSAVLAGLYTQAGESSTTRRNELSDQHTVNVTVICFEIVLLLATIGITLLTVAQHAIQISFEVLSPGAFTLPALGDWASMVGLVIFAYVSTGLFNLCSYPSLFESRAGQRWSRLTRVVALGTLIAMLVYLAWSLTSAVALSPETLIQLDAAKEYTTIGIARTLAGIDLTSALLITLFGYSLALLAVTSACNGFTESLADQISVFLQDEGLHNGLTGDPENLHLRLLILVAALLTAFGIDRLIQINISTILAVAGIAGGGLLILVLPFFLPAPGQQKTSWTCIMLGFSSALLLTLLGLNAANLPQVHDLASAIVAGVSVLIALSILGVAVWLIRSEPEANVEEPFETLEFSPWQETERVA